MRLACIVEGYGEVQAVPILLRRLVNALDPTLVLQVEPPIRTPKSKLLQGGELERAVELAARKIGGIGAILILLDSDQDCPAELHLVCLSAPAQPAATFPSRWCSPNMSSRPGFWQPPNRYAVAGVCEMTWKFLLSLKACAAPKSG